MALLKGKETEIPKDAIKLNRDEAIIYQIKIMNSWKQASDVFAYKYGCVILGGFSSLAGIFINNHCRMKFKLGNIGRLSSYLPIVVLPAVLSSLTHLEFVTTFFLLQDQCPVCVEMRAASLQAIVGLVLPSILAPLSALPLAMQYCTYNVPFITKEPVKVFQLWKKQTKPIGNILFAIFISQAVMGLIVTHFEAKSVHIVNEKLAKLEYDLENSNVL